MALGPIDLSRVDVIARDLAGREWSARRTEPTLAVFDALPAGEYLLLVDAARSLEPLRQEGQQVRFHVQAGAPLELRLPLSGRPLRFGGSP
jgi:hypothetical protein